MLSSMVSVGRRTAAEEGRREARATAQERRDEAAAGGDAAGSRNHQQMITLFPEGMDGVYLYNIMTCDDRGLGDWSDGLGRAPDATALERALCRQQTVELYLPGGTFPLAICINMYCKSAH